MTTKNRVPGKVFRQLFRETIVSRRLLVPKLAERQFLATARSLDWTEAEARTEAEMFCDEWEAKIEAMLTQMVSLPKDRRNGPDE